MPSDDPVPSIRGAVRYSRLDQNPPVLRVDLGAVRFFAVELASDPTLFDSANAALRTSDPFFASWTAGLTGPVEETTFAIPPAAWVKLSAKNAVYYRVLTSTAGDGWQAPATSTPIDQAQNAPRIVITDDEPSPSPRSVFGVRG